ncbi:hypothetical protein N1027_12975 [Herbiconiux sp. CPCC 205763]|uniref:Tetratricopeptide repeat protein n=1 Tax=Herbiconiux aconitum TaxID=2970913 RepID=A0ABT2GSA1_9MICO|nr:hypothetical protein [Herbiconiux aconitum]MCS5719048.1 hypothetical protein [Herbiconiux aconitum]
MPTGQVERALLQSAVHLSDALDDDVLGYESRLRLSAWAAASGDSTTRLRAFDRCLELHLSDPLRFPATVGDLDLLWDFASIPRLLASSPRYDRETISACLDEMLEVFSFQGADLRALDFARFEVAAALGDGALAAESLARATTGFGSQNGRKVRAEPLLCDACVLSAEIVWHARSGRLDRAAAAADRLRGSGVACADEPELGLSRSLVPYLLTGRLDDARDVHLSGYERVRHGAHNLEAVAAHIEFAVRVGALRRARELVERHACWLAADPLAESAHFALLCAAGGAMDALTRSGRGGSAITPNDAPTLAPHLGARIGGWTATTFAKACWTAASGLADAFDARNGSDRFARRLDEARAIRPVTAWEPSPWRRELGDRDDRDDRDDRNDRRHLPGRPAAAVFGAEAVAGIERAAPADQRLVEPRALLASAREYAAVGDRRAAEAAIDDALPRADPLTRAELFAVRIRMHVERGEIRSAEQQLAQRVDCLIVDDLDDDAELDLQLGLLLFGAPLAGQEDVLGKAVERAGELGLDQGPRLRIAVALATLFLQEGRLLEAESLLSSALAGVVGVRRSPGLFVLADVNFALGRAQEALAAIDVLLGDPIDRALRASALLRRSTVIFLLDPHEAAAAIEHAIDDADRALQLYVELGHCEGVLDACGVLGHLLSRVGSVEGALEALRTAHQTAERFGHPDVDAMAFRLACALVRADRGGEARRLLEDVVEAMSAEGDPSLRAEAFYWLGHASRATDDDPAAYCLWSLALEEFGRVADEHGSARAGIAFGRLLLDNDDPASVPVLQEAARRARTSRGEEGERAPGGGVPASTLLIDALHLLARAQAAFGDPVALRTLDDVVSEAIALNCFEPLLNASVAESRARALDDLDREGEAIVVAREAASLFDASGEPGAAARLCVFSARLLARTGDIDEADALYRAGLIRYDAAAKGGRSDAPPPFERAIAAQEHEALSARRL